MPIYVRQPPSVRDLRRILGAQPQRLSGGLRIAERHASALRSNLHELELLIAHGWDLVEFVGARTPSWPPIPGPRRPPTLHEAMRIVLIAHGNGWLHASELAVRIARRGLYRRRDGSPASPKDVSARASGYPDLFERQGTVIRLRGVPPPED